MAVKCHLTKYATSEAWGTLLPSAEGATARRSVQGRVVKSDLTPVPSPTGEGRLRAGITPSPLGEGWGGVGFALTELRGWVLSMLVNGQVKVK